MREYSAAASVDCTAELNDVDQESAIRQIAFLYEGVVTTSELLSFK